MFRNVVFSRVVSISKARRFCLSLSRAHSKTRDERRTSSSPDFLSLWCASNPRKEDGRLWKRGKDVVPVCQRSNPNKQQKLTLIFRCFSNYSRAEKTNRDGLNRAQPDVARPGVQGENDGAEEILRETEHGRRPGGRDDGGHGDHAGATRSAGGFGKLPR